jgi:hypothetical protein
MINKELKKERDKKYREKNKEKIKEYWKKYYIKNKQKCISRMSVYGKTENGKISRKKYQEKNKSNINRAKNKYYKTEKFKSALKKYSSKPDVRKRRNIEQLKWLYANPERLIKQSELRNERCKTKKEFKNMINARKIINAVESGL